MSFLCLPRCKFVAYRPDQFLRHLADCEHIAPWVRDWANRVGPREKWRELVGVK